MLVHWALTDFHTGRISLPCPLELFLISCSAGLFQGDFIGKASTRGASEISAYSGRVAQRAFKGLEHCVLQCTQKEF